MLTELKAMISKNYLFYVNEYNYYLVKVIINRLKHEKSDIRIFLGGPSAEYIGLNHWKDINVDIYIVNEPPITLLNILNNDKKLEGIKNIIYRTEEGITVTEKQFFEYSLDNIGFPYSSGFIPVTEIQNVGMITSTGCYGNCSFCSYHKQFKFHSIEGVINEIEFIDRYIRDERVNLNFLDDCFAGSPERTLKLCEEIFHRGLKFTYWCCTRADLLTEEIIEIMSKCNFKEIVIGLETASKKVLTNLGKLREGDQADKYLENLVHVYTLCKERGINPFVSANFGLPLEEYDDALETIEFAKEHKMNRNVSVCYMTAFPGSKVFDKSEKYSTKKSVSSTILPYKTYYKPYIMNLYKRLEHEGFTNMSLTEQRVKANMMEVITGMKNDAGALERASIKNIIVDTINEESLSFIDKNIDPNGNILCLKENLQVKRNGFYSDDRKHLKIEIADYDENLAEGYKTNTFIPNQLFYCIRNGEAYLQYNDIILIDRNNIKIRSLKTKEDYEELAQEARLFSENKINEDALDRGIIENGCRFVGKCYLKTLNRVSIKNNNVIGCEKERIIGTIEDTYEKLLKNISVNIDSTEKKRNCNQCEKYQTCSICLSPSPSLTEEEFCQFIKRNNHVSNYVEFIYRYHIERNQTINRERM